VALDFVMVKIVESGTSMKYNAENTFVLFYFNGENSGEWN